MKYCQQCKTEIPNEAVLCPDCGGILQLLPEESAETNGSAADTDAATAEAVEYAAMESMDLNTAEQAQAALAERKNRQKRRRKKILLALLAFVLVIALLLGGAMLFAWWHFNHYSDEGEDLPQKIHQIFQGNLYKIIENGEAQIYGTYIQPDDELGVEAYRALLPNGWEAGGRLSWNFPSASEPAMYSLIAHSSDKLARFSAFSPIMFAENSKETETTILQGKLAMPRTKEDAPSFILWFLEPLLLVKNISSSAPKNLDTDGSLRKLYEKSLEPVKAAAKAQGLTLSDIRYAFTEFSGGGILKETETAVDTCLRLAVCSYTLTKGSGNAKETVTVWGTPIIQFSHAPDGKMGEYAADMDFIAANQVVNQNWLAARSRAAAEAQKRIEKNKIADWSLLADEKSSLLSAAKKGLKKEPDYRVPSGGINSNSFAPMILDSNLFLAQDGTQMHTPKQFAKVWMTYQDDAPILLGVKDASYKPGDGFRWTELEKK